MKDISSKMLELLMDCHERQLQNVEPISIYYSKYGKGLLTRGLLELKPFLKNGKTIMCYFITEEGIRFLDGMLAST